MIPQLLTSRFYLRQVSPLLLSFLSLGLASAEPTATGQTAPAETPKKKAISFQSIPLTQVKEGAFYLIKGSYNKQELHFLLDSGASFEVMMNKDWATAQKLPLKSTGNAKGIAGEHETFATELLNLEIANFLNIPKCPSLISHLPAQLKFTDLESDAPVQLQGLLGATFLRNAQSILSFKHKRLLIPSTNAPRTAYLNSALAQGFKSVALAKNANGCPLLKVELGETNYVFLIDNAAGANVLIPEVAKALNLHLNSQDRKVLGGGGSTQAKETALIKNFPISPDFSLPEAKFLVMPCPNVGSFPEGTTFAGIIGNQFLNDYEIELDFASYHMIYDPKRAANPLNKTTVKQIKLTGKNADEMLESAASQAFHSEPLFLSQEGSYYMKALLNGQEYWMCLDSGADSVILHNRIAKELKIQLTPSGKATGADGTPLPLSKGVLKEFNVGQTAYENAPVLFTDLSNFGEFTLKDGTKHSCAGQLGMGYLHGIPATIDFKNSRVLIRDKAAQMGYSSLAKQLGVPTMTLIEDKKGAHYAPVEIMGQKGYLHVDTGAQSALLFKNTAETLKLKTRLMDGKANTLGAKQVDRYSTSISELKLGEHKVIPSVEMVVLPYNNNEKVNGLPVFGILGNTFFRSFGLFIDFDENSASIPPSFIGK